MTNCNHRFSNMVGYAWCASKVCDERDIFININEVGFPAYLFRTPFSCTKSSYICCSRCRNIFCFSCFYDNYHSGFSVYMIMWQTALIVHIFLVVFFLLVISIKISFSIYNFSWHIPRVYEYLQAKRFFKFAKFRETLFYSTNLITLQHDRLSNNKMLYCYIFLHFHPVSLQGMKY